MKPRTEPASISLLGRLMPTIMKLRGSNRKYLSAEAVHRHLDELLVRPRPVAAPKSLRKDVAVSAKLDHGWRIFTITPTVPTRGTVIYLHGGGWIHEAASAHWKWVQQLASEAAVEVLMPVYPLAHEGGTAATVIPFIADLVDQCDGPVILMGDSAGGSIAMSASLILKARGKPVPLTVLISPGIDLRLINPAIEAVQPSDPWLVKVGQLELIKLWLGEHLDDPILNPIHGDLHGLHKLVIYSGTRDILNPDTRLFAQRARDAGVDVLYREAEGHIHDYPLLPIPEAKTAKREIVDLVRQTTAATA